MTDAIYAEKFLAVKEAAWHRIGEVIQEPIKTSAAVKRAKLDYGVTKQELFLADGTKTEWSAVVREPDSTGGDRAVLGVAKDYEIVHITDIVEQLDSIEWPLSAIGAINNGADIFAAYDLGGATIAGEEYAHYVGLVHPYVPGQTWKIVFTPVRMVCKNTVMAGLAAATSRIDVVHQGGAKLKIDAAVLATKARMMMADTSQLLERLTDVVMDPESTEAVMAATYPYVRPMPSLVVDPEAWEKRHEAELRQVAKLKDGLTEVYSTFNEQFPALAGTGYALYQSVVEFSDYRVAGKKEGMVARVGQSSLFGARAAEKRRAFDAIFSL